MRRRWQQKKGKGGTWGQRDGGERKNMRISGEINDAATPSGNQRAPNDALESIQTHASMQAFSAN